VLDEYERWTGDADFVRRLEPNARAARLERQRLVGREEADRLPELFGGFERDET
jgi:hypothetical protein